MRVLLVTAHPRPGSLTAAVAAAFAEAAAANGHVIETADLMAEGFDPALREDDEPDWSNPAKTYSPAVRAEMARILRNEATVMIWPVWWWSLPAVLKGWIDRVWNNGWAYGDDGARYPHDHVWSIGLAGGDRATYVRRGYDKAIEVQVETGILRYCKVPHPRQVLIYGTLDGDDARTAALATARRLGSEL